MPQTIGYHFVKSTYGTWFPGDARGHWSDAWDAQIGYFEPHHLHDGDPIRKRMAEERMQRPRVNATAVYVHRAILKARPAVALREHIALLRDHWSRLFSVPRFR